MESREEAHMRSDGSVKIQYYYGKTIVIPKEVMEKNGLRVLDNIKEMIMSHEVQSSQVAKVGCKNGRV